MKFESRSTILKRFLMSRVLKREKVTFYTVLQVDCVLKDIHIMKLSRYIVFL